jgi:hypothetical protein
MILLFFTQIFIAIGTPFLFLILYFFQKLYLRTSRQIRFLDIEKRADVLSDFLETVRSSCFFSVSILGLRLTFRSSKGPHIYVP